MYRVEIIGIIQFINLIKSTTMLFIWKKQESYYENRRCQDSQKVCDHF